MSDEETFRHELRVWLESNFDADTRDAVRSSDEDEQFEAHRRWNAILVDAGYGAVAWPKQYGGRDAGILEQLAYTEEMAMSGAPGPINAIGVANIAPAIMAYGTDEQKDRFLKPILRGDEIWSQGMSEPDAGSDLASLSCRAIRDGDDFIINGQKTWNSNGHRAQWCQLYVRTDVDAPKHKGITTLLVDLTLPGIEARPVVSMAGDVGFSELFFSDARVPVSSLLGELNEGWGVATNTLSHERAGVASLYLMVRKTYDDLVTEAGESRPDGTRALDDAVVRDSLMKSYARVRNLEFLAKRMLGATIAGNTPGAEASVIKLAWSQTSQSLGTLAVDILGMAALDGRWARGMLGSR
ncbi:MAG: acyl-CoA dehydrogenase family protein, partial [Acidobacteria bacterium]|nr:acyl-CoA dehydrogenase family protein [Acidobacteriota bacterium]